MIKRKNILIELIVTCFFVGKIKYAPGTFGSLLAFPLSYFVVTMTLPLGFTLNLPNINKYQSDFFAIIVVLFAVIIALFILGTICSSIYVKNTGREDPKEVVIDEVVGQMIVIVLGSLSVAFVHYSWLGERLGGATTDLIFLFALPFTLFRIFDIIKPFPINWVDRKIKGGIGIMLDDVLAAIFAVVMQYAITFVVVDFFG
ncbi:MAG: phosphatidylglycerophosphatase A [Pseudomonadota bacterium]